MRIDPKKIKSITFWILKEISTFADEIIGPLTYRELKRRCYYMEGDPRRLSNNIKSLERRGYIKINRNSNSVELTNKGQIKLIENSSDNVVDGKWRMLSFDIPEPLSKKRDQLRRSIKRISYKQVQKSLWASPFARADQVELIIKELGLEKYVAYLLVEKTDIDPYLRQLFKDEIKRSKQK